MGGRSVEAIVKLYFCGLLGVPFLKLLGVEVLYYFPEVLVLPPDGDGLAVEFFVIPDELAPVFFDPVHLVLNQAVVFPKQEKLLSLLFALFGPLYVVGALLVPGYLLLQLPLEPPVLLAECR